MYSGRKSGTSAAVGSSGTPYARTACISHFRWAPEYMEYGEKGQRSVAKTIATSDMPMTKMRTALTPTRRVRDMPATKGLGERMRDRSKRRKREMKPPIAAEDDRGHDGTRPGPLRAASFRT